MYKKLSITFDEMVSAYYELASDTERESEALSWSEGVIGDVNDVNGNVWWVDFNNSEGK